MALKFALREHSLASVPSLVLFRESSLANVLSPVALRERFLANVNSLLNVPSRAFRRERSLCELSLTDTLSMAESFSSAPL